MSKIDPADVLLFAGLASLTIGAAFAHVALAFIVFGIGAMYIGLLAGRTVEK